MSTIYSQAATILQQFWDKKASLKTLVYNSSSTKKGYLLAICSKTLQAQCILEEIVNSIPEFNETAIHNQSLFYVMLYDELFGEGIRGGGQIPKLIRSAQSSIDLFLQHRMKEMNVTKKEDLLPKASIGEKWKFVRVNRVKTTTEKVLSELQRIISYNKSLELQAGDCVQQDSMISCLIRIPSSLDLHQHSLVLSHSIVLQTKASCFPPYFLLHDLYDSSASKPSFDVIDATAAPGNKTTFLGDLLRNRGTVYAFDRDAKRFAILQKRCEAYGSGNIVCIHGDFLQSNPFDPQFANVQRIQLDPSCSGSGMSHTSFDDSKPSPNRLKHLTEFQLACIMHAARFPSVTRISYSTCSIYEEEDERVVAKALKELNKEKKVWYIEEVTSSIPPRGHVVEGLSEEEAKRVIRCEMGDGFGQGFFVCVFARKEGMVERNCRDKGIGYEEESKQMNKGEIGEGYENKSEQIKKRKAEDEFENKSKHIKRTNPNKPNTIVEEKPSHSIPKEKTKKTPFDYISKIKSIKRTKHGKKVPLGWKPSYSLTCCNHIRTPSNNEIHNYIEKFILLHGENIPQN